MKFYRFKVRRLEMSDLIPTPVLPDPASVTLTSAKYPDVMFYANYHSNTTDSNIYRFSSGIILDSSEIQQYKIVFASYDVKADKVTFVERALT